MNFNYKWALWAAIAAIIIGLLGIAFRKLEAWFKTHQFAGLVVFAVVAALLFGFVYGNQFDKLNECMKTQTLPQCFFPVHQG